eukprot:TRINITY_DN4289_c0_g1_i1.p2 TRINITY_DN4289_c0_g1~~TRINITY_DN4289_c0_g1_i1.p2  ORF type:complete len:322 (+),score=86.52 TRINITY_DN4289_c0_g1_i1:706-1671(+)
MERLEIDLATMLAKRHLNQPMLVMDALQLGIDLARGVRHLHAAGWLHRDLKPQNLGLTAAGVLKIMDFGLARRLPPGPRTDRYVMTGATGSLRYMAPEVMLQRPYNSAVDIYSVGVIVLELLERNSEKPFCLLPREGFAEQVIRGYRPPVRHLPANIAALLQRCWHAEPDQRPDAPTLVHELCDILLKFMDTKWKVRPSDLLFDWSGHHRRQEYDGALKDFEARCARCPEPIIIETAAQRFINCISKMKARNDPDWQEVDRRLHAFAAHYRLKLTPRVPTGAPPDPRGPYVPLSQLREQELPSEWPSTFEPTTGAAQCTLM